MEPIFCEACGSRDTRTLATLQVRCKHCGHLSQPAPKPARVCPQCGYIEGNMVQKGFSLRDEK